MSLSENIARLRIAIDQAARQTGRTDTVQLVAVSKTVTPAHLEETLQAGQRVFAENYVQEAKAKWPAFRTKYPDIHLRLIGHLQTNKAEDAVRLFDRIDTLDRVKGAQALARAMDKTGRRIPLLIEVNIGKEPQKAGCLPEDLPELVAAARKLDLDLQGLMCVPPAGQDPRPSFEACVHLAREQGLERLSMGMSGDFETAIACGTHEVRIGTAIFGARG